MRRKGFEIYVPENVVFQLSNLNDSLVMEF